MSTSDTLFCHLALRFSPHPENLDTEALLYLLNNSRDANGLFSGYLSSCGQDFPPVTRFSSQVSSDDDTIPDLVATDVAGNKIFIVENKFWAELTPNQPVGYLPLLSKQTPSALFFVCPEKRLSVLEAELGHLISNSSEYPNYQHMQRSEDIALSRLTGTQFLVVVSWRRLLADLEVLLDPIAERTLVADLHQLNGLCDQMDQEGFIPLRTNETGNMEIPRRIIDYSNLIDDIVDELRESGDISTDGLARTSTTEFTGRYIHIRNRGEIEGLLALDFAAWRKFGRSPIWLEFSSQQSVQRQEVASILSKTKLPLVDLATYARRGWGGIATPITLMPNTDKRKVIENCAVQIREIADILLAGSA